MPDENVKPSAALPVVQAGLDSPTSGQGIGDKAIFVSGWFEAPGRDATTCVVCAYVDDDFCGETRILFPRADGRTGFRILGKMATAGNEPRDGKLRVIASWDGGSSTMLAEQPVRLVPAVLQERP